MITHFIKSINWVDVALAILFIRMIFVGVKNGFVSEFFKLIGTVFAIFVSLHSYSFLAAWVSEKLHLAWGYWDLLIFADLWVVVALFFKYFKDGMLVLFKVEAVHQGFDKYAGGVVAVVRGILVCSLTIFLLLLVNNNSLTRMTLRSYSFKFAGQVSVSTYTYLYKNLIDKLFTGEHYNSAVLQVIRPVK